MGNKIKNRVKKIEDIIGTTANDNRAVVIFRKKDETQDEALERHCGEYPEDRGDDKLHIIVSFV